MGEEICPLHVIHPENSVHTYTHFFWRSELTGNSHTLPTHVAVSTVSFTAAGAGMFHVGMNYADFCISTKQHVTYHTSSQSVCECVCVYVSVCVEAGGGMVKT